MKRFTAVLLSFVLLLSCASVASAAKMIQTFSNKYFQMYIPGDWIIDTSSAAEYWGLLDFGYMYAEDESMLIDSKLFFYSDWATDSLRSGDPAQWKAYIEFLMDDLAENNPEVVSSFYAGQYPGVILRCSSESGAYLYGEIMIKAYAYGFYFYQYNEDGSINSDISDENIELFESILETFILLN